MRGTCYGPRHIRDCLPNISASTTDTESVPRAPECFLRDRCESVLQRDPRQLDGEQRGSWYLSWIMRLLKVPPAFRALRTRRTSHKEKAFVTSRSLGRRKISRVERIQRFFDYETPGEFPTTTRPRVFVEKAHRAPRPPQTRPTMNIAAILAGSPEEGNGKAKGQVRQGNNGTRNRRPEILAYNTSECLMTATHPTIFRPRHIRDSSYNCSTSFQDPRASRTGLLSYSNDNRDGPKKTRPSAHEAACDSLP